MEEGVRKEVQTILDMVARWKVFWFSEYRDPASCPHIDDPNEWIVDEFTQLIAGGDYYQQGLVLPYLRRLEQTGLITPIELESILERIYGEIQDLRRLLGLQDAENGSVEGDK
jgi:hypothetical protein